MTSPGRRRAAAEAGEPVGASAAPEALSAKTMAKQLFDYLLGTFQAALSPDVLSDLGDVLVARGRRSVVLPGGHRAGPPGPFVRGGSALRPYRRGHIEDARVCRLMNRCIFQYSDQSHKTRQNAAI